MIRLCQLAAMVLLGSVFAMAASPSKAGDCGYDYCWGAVAVNTSGGYGFSYGQISEDAAISVAQDGCGWNCTTVRSFYNSCAAIAMADNGGWGWAYEVSRDLAESSAMNYCMDYGRNCRVVVWSCSP
jgi:hypothetical protein